MSYEREPANERAKRLPRTAYEDADLLFELFASPDTPVDVRAHVEDALFTFAEAVCVNLSHPKLVAMAYLLMLRSMHEYEEEGGTASERMREAHARLKHVLNELRQGEVTVALIHLALLGPSAASQKTRISHEFRAELHR